MFAASLQEAFHIWACEKLQQAYSKPNLHGKMFAANMHAVTCSNVCSKLAAIFAASQLFW